MDIRDIILAANDLPREPVRVPEWDTTVAVRTLTGAERDQWERETWEDKQGDRLRNVRARLVAWCVCDEAGGRVFQDADVPALSGKSGRALDRVYAVAARLNGITKEEEAELVKN